MPAEPTSETISISVEAEDVGQRLDRVLTLRLAGALGEEALSRARVQALVRDGAVLGAAGSAVQDPGQKVRGGEVYRVLLPAPKPAEPAGEDIPLVVVHEDADLVVIDKPAGLVVHPAAGHEDGTLVNALISHCGESLSGIGGIRRPGIVHRLDKDTSGLLVVAKTDRAHQKLSEQFANHGADGRLERTYLAIAWGAPERAEGTIDAPLARSATQRTKIAVVRGEAGRRAVTHFKVLERFEVGEGRQHRTIACLMALTLETGRTHQIRVHLAHIGHPILGDAVYGAGFKASERLLGPQAVAALERLGRQALHAARLGFRHPRGGRQMRFESSLPPEMAALAEALRRQR